LSISGIVKVFIVAGQSNAIPLGEPVRRRLADIIDGAISVIHVAEGGTPLVNAPYATPSWHPERRGEMYDRLRFHIDTTLIEIRAQGLTPIPEAVFWMQGEQDGKTKGVGTAGTSLPPPPQPLAAESYEANLRLLIGTLRNDLCRPNLPFIMATTPVGSPPDYLLTDSEHLAIPAILAAQAAVATSTPGVSLVETMDCERAADRVHLTERSADEVTRRMIEKYSSLSPHYRGPLSVDPISS